MSDMGLIGAAFTQVVQKLKSNFTLKLIKLSQRERLIHNSVNIHSSSDMREGEESIYFSYVFSTFSEILKYLLLKTPEMEHPASQTA